MEDVIEAHPEWTGLVTGVLMNKFGSQSGLDNCAAQMDVALFQAGGGAWAAFGASSYTAQVYDQAGTLIHVIPSALFTSNQDKVEELEAAVAELL